MTIQGPLIDRLPRRRNSVASGLIGVVAGVVLAVCLLGIAVWISTGIGLLHLLGMTRGGRTLINVDQPSVVRQIQQLRRLETVNYTIDKIISGERGADYIPKFLVGDRLLLMVHGEVVAGVDLAKLQPKDVSVQGRNISLHLPRAEVFSTRIDNTRTRVYSRDTGLFSSPDPNLESEVREEAERQLQAAALQDGILKAADQNARNTIVSMLKGLGFSKVQIAD
ncbi:MAG TPA: DUF4230 domain-containing protein [Candidatus Sulfotelmatobacter sp.]